MEKRLAEQTSRRIAKAIASYVAESASRSINEAWADLDEPTRLEHINAWAERTNGILRHVLSNDDPETPDELVGAMAAYFGYEDLLEKVLQSWADKRHGGDRSEIPTIGPGLMELTACGCEDPGDCPWCVGTGKLTHMAKAAKDDAERAGVLPVPPPEGGTFDGEIPRAPLTVHEAFVQRMRGLGAVRVDVTHRGGLRVDFAIERDGTIAPNCTKCRAIMILCEDKAGQWWRCPDCDCRKEDRS